MGLWTDLAEWVGPTPNRGGAMIEWRGVVLHIAEGSYLGTIAWQKNDVSNVSSHFIVAKDGRCAQMVDTDQVAWTQAQGNGHWLSIENEGFQPVELTPAQFEVNAQLIAKAHRIYGFPLVLAETPSQRGLGWHGMGGTAWGGHPNCPGEPIKAQRDDLLVRVQQILNGNTPQPPEDDMAAVSHLWLGTDGKYYHVTGPCQEKRAMDKAAADQIRYFAKGGDPNSGLKGWDLNDMERFGATDPSQIPGKLMTDSSGGAAGPFNFTGTAVPAP